MGFLHLVFGVRYFVLRLFGCIGADEGACMKQMKMVWCMCEASMVCDVVLCSKVGDFGYGQIRDKLLVKVSGGNEVSVLTYISHLQFDVVPNGDVLLS